MNNPRIYGRRPLTIAVVHGGPGAPGEMAPVARELSAGRGVLEPLLTAATLEGQVQELKTLLEGSGDLPITLLGFSWGAMLGFILASHFPLLVRKLILVSSGPYEEEYATGIMSTRLDHLGEGERKEVLGLLATLEDPADRGKNNRITRLGELLSKADSYDPLPYENEIIEYQDDIYRVVWRQASELRRSGELLEMGRKIRCLVVAIHGDYDPHPSAGVSIPLSRTLNDFRFIQLKKCGHYPWRERYARDEFYRILKEEM